MANSTSNDETVEGSWSPRRPRTAAEQRAESSPEPKDVETLSSDIDKTREELAQTLDAIADKVSPKKVAARTGQKVTDSVKESAAKAGESLKVGAASAAETAKGAAEAVKESAIAAKQSAAAQVAEVKEKVGSNGSGDQAVVAFAPVSQDTSTLPVSSAGALADADPGVTVAPPGAEVPLYAIPAPAASSKLPLYGGAGAAVLAVLLVLRRRRRR